MSDALTPERRDPDLFLHPQPDVPMGCMGVSLLCQAMPKGPCTTTPSNWHRARPFAKIQKALGLYNAAAKQGHAKAEAKTGHYFEDAVVVGQDLAIALGSYRRGAEDGDFCGQFC